MQNEGGRFKGFLTGLGYGIVFGSGILLLVLLMGLLANHVRAHESSHVDNWQQPIRSTATDDLIYQQLIYPNDMHDEIVIFEPRSDLCAKRNRMNRAILEYIAQYEQQAPEAYVDVKRQVQESMCDE